VTEQTLYWITSLASLAGVWLNIHGRRACFAIWAVTNSVWAYADLTHGIYPQAVLQLTYVGLAVYGLVRWSDRRLVRNRGCEQGDSAS
jgi:nicotinamide riboside transporter PnuC